MHLFAQRIPVTGGLIFYESGDSLAIRTHYFYQGDPCRVRSGLQNGGILWKNKLSSGPREKTRHPGLWPAPLLSSSVMNNLQKHRLLPSRPLSHSKKKSKMRVATDRKQAEEIPAQHPEEAAPGGPAPWAGRREATKPPAHISSRCLLFTNLHFTPPCSKHK